MAILVTTQDLARKYRDAQCTLNGKQARVIPTVVGARVCTVPFGISADFSWPAVDRVMTTSNGEFKA